MKKNFNLSIFILACFSLSIIGCNDDTADDESSLNPREEKIKKLAGTEGKTWILQGVNARGLNITQWVVADCDLDNLYILYPSGEGEYRSGEEKCEEDNPDVLETGEWELSEDLETLTLTIGMINDETQILDLTDDRMSLQFTFEGQTATLTFEAGN